MRDLNIDFMDLYKRTDRFIKDAYSSSEGVQSTYVQWNPALTRETAVFEAGKMIMITLNTYVG